MEFLAGFGLVVLVILLAAFFPRVSFVMATLIILINSGLVADHSPKLFVLSLLAIIAFVADAITLTVLNDNRQKSA